MPPFKKSVNLEDLIEQKKLQIEALRNQCSAVETMLAINTDQQFRLKAEKGGIVRSTAEASLEIEDVEQSLESQVKYMTTLSKNTEEHLKNKYNSLLKTQADVEKENDDLRKKLEMLIERRTVDLEKWEKDVQDKEKEIEEKALGFGLRLKDTLLRVDIR